MIMLLVSRDVFSHHNLRLIILPYESIISDACMRIHDCNVTLQHSCHRLVRMGSCLRRLPAYLKGPYPGDHPDV